MLKREYRLRKKYMFAYCYRAGKTVRSKALIMYYTPSKNKNVKVGISVSKKVGGAVSRNRARRVIREAITPFLVNINNNFNLILVAKENLLSFSFGEIKNQIEQMITKAGIYCENNN